MKLKISIISTVCQLSNNEELKWYSIQVESIAKKIASWNSGLQLIKCQNGGIKDHPIVMDPSWLYAWDGWNGKFFPAPFNQARAAPSSPSGSPHAHIILWRRRYLARAEGTCKGTRRQQPTRRRRRETSTSFGWLSKRPCLDAVCWGKKWRSKPFTTPRSLGAKSSLNQCFKASNLKPVPSRMYVKTFA